MLCHTTQHWPLSSFCRRGKWTRIPIRRTAGFVFRHHEVKHLFILNRQRFWLALRPPSLQRWAPWVALSTSLTSGTPNPLRPFTRPFSLNPPSSISCKYCPLLAATLSSLVCWELQGSHNSFKFSVLHVLFWKLIYWLGSTFKKYRAVCSEMSLTHPCPQTPRSPSWRQSVTNFSGLLSRDSLSRNRQKNKSFLLFTQIISKHWEDARHFYCTNFMC